MAKKISSGTIHKLPQDFYGYLASDKKAALQWESLTPLARNEWICWVTFVKKQETRDEHVTRAVSQLKQGKRRPCCWIGCIHRKDKELSPSIKAVLRGELGKKIKK